jgi:hypothetical protein
MISFRPLRPLFQVTAYNWKPVLYTSMLISAKYYEELNMPTDIMVGALRLFEVHETTRWMHFFLNLLDFDVSITEEEFDANYKSLVLYKAFQERD